MKKKICFTLAVVFLAISVLFLHEAAVENRTENADINIIQSAISEPYHAKSVYVYDLTDDKEVLAVNEKERHYPASLVKIMTVYVALQNIEELSETAPVDVDSYIRCVEENSSMAGFVGNEKTTYRDLLYGAMLPSGGECANSIAVNVSGGVNEFVCMMNDIACVVGLDSTNYVNVDGLDDVDQYTTARDVAYLLKHCLCDGNFRAIFTRKNYDSTHTLDHPDGLRMDSTVFSKLNNYDYSGFEIIGGKSGTTEKAGLCWVTLCTKNGKEYIVVVMGSPLGDINAPNDGHIKDTLRILREL